MQFCIRREIEFSACEERLKRVRGVPIEISLRPLLHELLENRHWLMDVKRMVKEFDIPVPSVHAPTIHFSHEYFRNAARLIVAFAESLGSSVVVFQPEKKSDAHQEGPDAVLQNIKLLQETTRVTLAVETFRDGERIMTPDAIMQHGLPMVLDTSLLPKPDITWIVESYRTHMVNLHLSAVTQGGEQHLAGRQFRPVENDPFCLDVLDRLHDLGWNGVVTLEYLPWLSDKSIEDRKLLETIYRDIP